MYVDSTATQGVASEQVVAKLLRQHVEPLLMVSVFPSCVTYLGMLETQRGV